MKLKVTERETDIDLPIYLHFQDKDYIDEYIRWDGRVQTIIKNNKAQLDWFGHMIQEIEYPLYIDESQLKNLCTESQFNKAFKETLESFSSQIINN